MNLYTILGIPKDADEDEVKKAYRTLAQKHHPDRKGGSRDAFVEIQMAYEVLSDPIRRAHYDATGTTMKSSADEAAEVRVRIISFLHGILEQIINNDGFDVSRNNVLDVLKNTIVANKKANEQAVARFEVLYKKRQEVISRLSRKDDEENVMVNMLTSANDRQNDQVNRLRSGILDFDNMYKMLDEYSYDFIAAAAVIVQAQPGGATYVYRAATA